jgi:predicted Zn-dependent peptidase
VTDLDLDFQQKALPNGLRLITIARLGTPTVAARLYVRAGSRYDVESKPAGSSHPPLGLAHLTEHLLFHGTLQRSQRQLFAAVERLGGTLDADTAKEYICLSSVVPPRGLPAALEVLAELWTEPALRKDELPGEKAIIGEEIRQAQDRASVLFDLFAQTMWPTHPLCHPIQGEPQSVLGLKVDDVRSFYRRRFVAGNALLVLCGQLAHEEAQGLAARIFSAVPRGPEQLPATTQERPLDGRRRDHRERNLQQASALIGVPTTDMKHPDRSALKVIERVLGWGGSARLYQRLREDARLVYSVNTVTAHYEDAGYFAVHSSCDPSHLPHLEQAILEIWEQLRQHGISEEELRDAQSNYAGTLARRFETNLALAGILGLEGLLHRVETLQEATQRIQAVTREDVLRAAQKYLDVERYVVASVGRSEGCEA